MSIQLLKFFRGFKYAFLGIVSGFKERNMRVHGLAACLVIVAGWVFSVSISEWIWLVTMIGLVWAAELVNTGIEELSNIVRDELKLEYSATKRARDVAAGAVLVLAIAAAIIGGLIFGPKIWQLI